MKKRNAMKAGVATIKIVDETKKAKEAKEKKKKPAFSDEDEENEGYYEDWNPDADENPDVDVNKVSMKDCKKVKDENNSDGKVKDTIPIDKKNIDKKDENKKEKKGGRKSKVSDEDDDDSEDDEYDNDDDYDDDDSEEEVYTCEDENKLKNNTKKIMNKDSGRGSASSALNDWEEDCTGDKSVDKTNESKSETQAEAKKKGGFLSKPFGNTKSNEESRSSITNNDPSNKTIKQNAKNVEFVHLDDD